MITARDCYENWMQSKMTREQKIDTFWKKMTNEEKMELACRSLFGQHILDKYGNIEKVIMSSYGLNRLHEYLIEKYFRK